MSVKSNCSTVSFRISVALLIFCLEDMSIGVSGLLRSPTVTVFLSISPFISVGFHFMYLSGSVLGAGLPSWLMLRESTCNAGNPGWFLVWKYSLERGMATHSSIPAQRIPWAEKPTGLQSMGLEGMRTTEHAHMHVRYIYVEKWKLSSCVDPFFIIYWSPLCSFMAFALKSILSDTSIVTQPSCH